MQVIRRGVDVAGGELSWLQDEAELRQRLGEHPLAVEARFVDKTSDAAVQWQCLIAAGAAQAGRQ